MRVHLRNVVESALEKGVVKGQHRITKLPKKKQENFDVVVNTMMKSIWESLDGIIDFTDDDEEPDNTEVTKKPVGFHLVDAVSDKETPRPKDSPDDEDDEDDDDDDVVPLDILYRLRKE